MPSFKAVTAPRSSLSGAVLKDHNHRHRPPIFSPRPSKQPSDDNYWVQTENGQNPDDRRHQAKSSMSRRQARVLDRWATQQARDTITTVEAPLSPARSREPSPGPSDSSVSSLVQKWRVIETQLKSNLSPQDQSLSGHSSGVSSVHLSRTNSFTSSNDQENDSSSSWNCDQSASENSHGGGSAEKERLRVVDIIKKLPLKEKEQVGTPEVHTPGKIRGWKTVANLLAKLERDRYNEIQATSERQAVSKFPKRGFLQSMMKLRLLRFGVPSQGHRAHESSKSPKKNADELAGDSVLQKRASTSEQPSRSKDFTDKNHHKERTLTQISNINPHTNEDEKDQVEMLGTTMATSGRSNHQDEEKEEMLVKIENAERRETGAGDEAVHFGSSGVHNTSWSSNVWEVEEGDMVYEEEEEVSDDYDFYGPNLDWISEISRPRSYWESLRQAWYQKVFSSSSNAEIRQLIERGSVSSVLASDFPDKMGQIMGSRVRRQMQSFRSESEEDEQCEDEVADEEPIENVDDVTEEPEQVVLEEDENDGYYYKQYSEEEENSEETESAPPQLEQSSVTNSNDEEESSSSMKNNSSTERELIYDLRAQMEQMYREMCEMRRTINSCVEMQARLQRCINDEVPATSNNKAEKRGCCSICYEKKVDSILYRCGGQMCACCKSCRCNGVAGNGGFR